MKCTECGTAMKSQIENYRYDECGLMFVTLIGVEMRCCPKCENYEVSIPRIEGLHEMIARTLIDKATEFTGAEVRFLRKCLGRSGSDFAQHMRVADETVSRWENAAAHKKATFTRLELRSRDEKWELLSA